ncbi:hypothetical protein M758_1G295200 [Ceratodon purpureus]|nr:hypothetical protein M758_1G295200 [Ceratodon purpureus]
MAAKESCCGRRTTVGAAGWSARLHPMPPPSAIIGCVRSRAMTDIRIATGLRAMAARFMAFAQTRSLSDIVWGACLLELALAGDRCQSSTELLRSRAESFAGAAGVMFILISGFAESEHASGYSAL